MRPGPPSGIHDPRGGPGLLFVQQLVVFVLAQAEIDAEPVAQPQQQLQLVAVLAPHARVDAGGSPVQRSAQVTLLGEQLRDQVAGARLLPGARSGEFGEQRVGFGGPAEREHRAGQRHPGIIERRARVGDGRMELRHGLGRLVSQQPLLAGPHVRLGPGHVVRRGLRGDRGLYGEPAHTHRGPFMVARAGSHELDSVEHVTGQCNHVLKRTPRGRAQSGVSPLPTGRSSASQNPRRSACRTSSCSRKSIGSAEPCSSRASRSDGIRGLRASTASSHSAGASLATESPNSWPSSCAACTASVSETPIPPADNRAAAR